MSAVLACLLAGGAAGATTTARLLAAINGARTAAHLQPLRLDPVLERAAEAHTLLLARTGALAHSAALPWRGPVVAENLAFFGGRTEPEAVVQAWLASPRHRANLLRPGFRLVGVAQVGSVVTADFAGR